jgi:hypothetical protein
MSSTAKNVAEIFEETLGVKVAKYENIDFADGLKEFPADSHCGRVCHDICTKAKELLDLCDTHEMIVDNILKGVTTAIGIVCFG